MEKEKDAQLYGTCNHFLPAPQKGWNNTQIAEFTGHHRDTIAKVLKEEIEKKPQKRNRASAVSAFDEQIGEWRDRECAS